MATPACSAVVSRSALPLPSYDSSLDSQNFLANNVADLPTWQTSPSAWKDRQRLSINGAGLLIFSELHKQSIHSLAPGRLPLARECCGGLQWRASQSAKGVRRSWIRELNRPQVHSRDTQRRRNTIVNTSSRSLRCQPIHSHAGFGTPNPESVPRVGSPPVDPYAIADIADLPLDSTFRAVHLSASALGLLLIAFATCPLFSEAAPILHALEPLPAVVGSRSTPSLDQSEPSKFETQSGSVVLEAPASAPPLAEPPLPPSRDLPVAQLSVLPLASTNADGVSTRQSMPVAEMKNSPLDLLSVPGVHSSFPDGRVPGNPSVAVTAGPLDQTLELTTLASCPLDGETAPPSPLAAAEHLSPLAWRDPLHSIAFLEEAEGREASAGPRESCLAGDEGGGGQVAPAEEPAAAPVTHESLVLEAWEVVNEAFLDARQKGWSQEAWQEKKAEVLRRPPRSRMAAHSAISTMLASLQDPYSRFITPDQFGQLAKYDVTGIGLNIGEEAAPAGATAGGAGGGTTRLKVLGIVLGSPAQLQGMRQGDELLAVEGIPVSGLSAFEVASMIQGPKGTPVTLEFRHTPCGPPETVTMPRTLDVRTPVTYRLERAAPALGGEGAEAAVGYIRLREFNALAKKDLVTAVERLQAAGATAFTLDLQDNPGGLVQAGIEIARLFLPEGATVIYTESRGPAQLRGVTATGRQITDAPITVLVNNRTASASEIVAAALHDNCRAVLVGGRTFGKGLIQSVYELSDGSGIILTVGKYVTPSHNDIDGNGIEPDFGRWPGAQKVKERLGSCRSPELAPALRQSSSSVTATS